MEIDVTTITLPLQKHIECLFLTTQENHAVISNLGFSPSSDLFCHEPARSAFLPEKPPEFACSLQLSPYKVNEVPAFRPFAEELAD